MFAILAVALELTAAKPPEPLEEILPLTSLIVDAVVVEVLEAPVAREVSTEKSPKQIVVLEVNRVVRGALPAAASPKEAADAPKDAASGRVRLVVTKPASAYTLRVGVKGPWLLALDGKTGERTILGRYGPDSYTFEKIEAKLAELKPAHLAR